jgi:long-chain acyl-CoA synthetase
LQLESIYRAPNLISNILIYASPTRSKPIAIVIPSPNILLAFASANNLPPKPIDQMIREPKDQRTGIEGAAEFGKESGAGVIEIVEGVVLADEEWSAQNVSAVKGKGKGGRECGSG